MKFMKFLIIAMMLFSTSVESKKSRILMMVLFGTKSHVTFMQNIAKELAARNHEVTYVMGFKTKSQGNENLIYKTIEGLENVVKEKFYLYPLEENHYNQFPYLWITFSKVVFESVPIAFEDKIMQDILYGPKKYDVFLTDALWNECLLAVAHHLDIPTVMISGNSLHPEHQRALSVPTPFSYVPQFLMQADEKMSYFKRIQNIYEYYSYYLIHQWFYYPTLEKIVERYLPGSPTIDEMVKNVSIVIATADGVVANTRPMMPFLFDGAGLHCYPSKPLPKDIEKAINSSGENGFIYFSLGSFVNSNIFTEKISQSIMEALSRVNYTVLWANALNVDNLPSNIKPFKWLPQQDILGHPKARLFLTHGGIHGLHEAVYHGVPAIGFGVFADQKPNLNRLETLGFAVMLDEYNMTADNVEAALKKVLFDPSYQETARHISQIFRDQPETALERSVKMIEYVIRHKGTAHLHYSQHLSFIEYFLLDVLATFLIATILIVYLSKRILRLIF